MEIFLTEENSADRLTRGLSVEELASKDTWWEGPLYLEGKKSEWAVDHIMKQQLKRSGNKHAYKQTAAIEGQLC